MHVPAAPARPRREISRARGDAEVEEEAAAAARRDAMAMGCLSLWFLGDGRRRGCKFLGSGNLYGLGWAVSKLETSPISDSSFVMSGFFFELALCLDSHLIIIYI